MKITNISCTQFAGVRDRSVALTDGINVIYGKNESGKSTLVNLIARTLFQDAKLDKRSDKDFIDNFFPSAKQGASYAADFADGKVTFETEQGTFTLTKEWGSDPRAVLSTPDGIIRDSATITTILRDALTYGEGVYTDMLFSSQRNTDLALQTILDASKKSDAKQEIANAVSHAFAESDGISTDAIEQAITAKIEEIEGKHWDFDREAPMRKVGRWAVAEKDPKKDRLLKAYYALEDAKAVLEEIARLEREFDSASADYVDADAVVRTAEEAYNRFNTFAGMLAVRSERKKRIDSIEAELKKITDVLSKWPTLAENLEKAKKLSSELATANTLALYTAAKAIHDELTALEAKLADMLCPETGEISAVKLAQRNITTLENKLCGMNVSATIKMLGGHQVEIKSLRTGELLDVTEAANITEAVSISVPGVMEMQLSPADVNVADIEQQLSEQRQRVQEIFVKYGVASLEALEKLAQDYATVQNEISAKNTKLTTTLGSLTFEDIKTQAEAITETPRTAEAISAEIMALCGSADVARFVISVETTIKTYEADYISIAELKAKAFDLQMDLSKARDSVSATEDIPAEFASISNPEGHLESLKDTLDAERKRREDALREKTATATSLERYLESVSGDPDANKEKAERMFEEQKALLAHWKHIAQVFARQKESITNNPLMDLAANFTHYLDIISGGKVASEFPDADKLNMNIYSSDRLIDYSKLSEGTKETVSLAFRLAVLDHLFPDGGGVAVFDDPFANMDTDRTAQACQLIKACAEKHQVIFLTCKEDYLEVLSGNRIHF